MSPLLIALTLLTLLPLILITKHGFALDIFECGIVCYFPFYIETLLTVRYFKGDFQRTKPFSLHPKRPTEPENSKSSEREYTMRDILHQRSLTLPILLVLRCFPTEGMCLEVELLNLVRGGSAF